MSKTCGKGDRVPSDHGPPCPRDCDHGTKCLIDLIGIFKRHACKDGDKTHLSKCELKEMLETEFCSLFKETKNPEEVNRVMGLLDHDKDGQVDIQEYFLTLCMLGICMGTCMDEKEGQCGKKC